MIKYVFLLIAYLLLGIGYGLRQSEETHQGVQSSTIEQKLTKIKQIKALLEDSDVNSLLKMNPQLYLSKQLGILQNSFSPQQTTLITQTKNLLSKWYQCTSQKPYFDGLICVSCSKQEIFDLETRKCARCRSGSIYDPKRKQCVKRSSKFNIALTEMDLERAQEIIMIRANHIAAGLMSFVVEKTQRLEERLQFQQFMTENKTTILSPNATNPHFLNLILLSTNQLIEQFKPKKEDIPCPKQKPFYNGNQCVSCSYPTHLFDATTKWCVKCSNNFIYSVKTHQCVELKKTSQKASG